MGDGAYEALGLSRKRCLYASTMKGPKMFIDYNDPKHDPEDYPYKEYDRTVDALFAREPKWRLAPFGVTLFPETQVRVYFDYDNRPILRLYPDGRSEILEADAFVYFRMLVDLHMDRDGSYDPDGPKIVRDLIEKYNLAPELQRRWELYLQGKLPDPAFGGRP